MYARPTTKTALPTKSITRSKSVEYKIHPEAQSGGTDETTRKGPDGVQMINRTVSTVPTVSDSTLHILVVDDAKSNRKLVCHLLKREGHTFCEAEDGQQCVDMVQFPPVNFDVILMDFGECET